MGKSEVKEWVALWHERLAPLAQEARELDRADPAYEEAFSTLWGKIAGLAEQAQREGLVQVERDHSPRAALATIAYCVNENLTIPEWATATLAWFYDEQNKGHYRSWDQIFGKPMTAGRAKRAQRDLGSLNAIADMVKSAQANGTPIDNELFERIGRELGIGSRTRVSELYSTWCRSPKPQHRKISRKKRRYPPLPS
jgi:hypothetical protein